MGNRKLETYGFGRELIFTEICGTGYVLYEDRRSAPGGFCCTVGNTSLYGIARQEAVDMTCGMEPIPEDSRMTVGFISMEDYGRVCGGTVCTRDIIIPPRDLMDSCRIPDGYIPIIYDETEQVFMDLAYVRLSGGVRRAA